MGSPTVGGSSQRARPGTFGRVFRIGEFARFARVSVKMLRHYDEVGLFRPAWVDPDNSYRYYRADQLPLLNRIVLLKDLGFGLSEIAALVESEPAAMEEAYRSREEDLGEELVEIHERLAVVRARRELVERHGDEPAYDVVVRAIPPALVAGLRDRLDPDQPIGELFYELEDHVRRLGARASLPPLTIFRGEDDQWNDVEVVVPLTHEIRGTDRIVVYTLQGVAEMATTVHTGGYGSIEGAL